MSWLQLTVETDAAHCDETADFLEQFSAVAISYSAASDEPLFDALDGREAGHWQRTRVTGLLPADVDLDILLVCLRDRIGADSIFDTGIKAVADQDWVSNYQHQLKPLLFADRLCVCPSWCEPPQGDFLTIALDPGLAFGTGSHATTALCLEWLAGHSLAGQSVIDFGCGSGILALAAARLGAATVTALDIDPQALQSCRGNVRNNRLEAKIRVGHPDQMTIYAADVLVANVLLNPLLELVDRFAALVRSNGRLVLSGLLPEQVDPCLAAYAACFNMQAPVFKDQWALLQGVRKS